MNNLFPPEIRTASTVKRWSIVRVMQPDSVAEHSYYVAFYAVQIARLIKWTGPMDDLMFYALMHDAEELITGDIVTPVKRAAQLDQADHFKDFVAGRMLTHLPLIQPQVEAILTGANGEVVRAIIKVADKVDALLYLIGEIRMGNVPLMPLWKDAETHLREAWERLGDLWAMDPGALWDDELWPAIQAYWKNGGVGLT